MWALGFSSNAYFGLFLERKCSKMVIKAWTNQTFIKAISKFPPWPFFVGFMANFSWCLAFLWSSWLIFENVCFTIRPGGNGSERHFEGVFVDEMKMSIYNDSSSFYLTTSKKWSRSYDGTCYCSCGFLTFRCRLL